MSTRPNIVFILIDDLGWRDLTSYGSSFYETPRLDQMAREGMRFTDAYASCPVCSPTRASVLTGKYPATLGVTNFIGGQTKGRLIDAPYIRQLEHRHTTVSKVLRENGYRTFHVGKWHLGADDFFPEKHGFDVNIAGCHMGHPKFGYFSPYQIPTLKDGPEGEYLTDRLTDDAIRLIQESNEPFFLNLWHYAVHTPIQPKPEDVSKYQEKVARLGIDQSTALELGEYFPCEHKKDKRVTRRVFQSNEKYAAMMENLDWNIGRLLDALEACGKAENTLVIFTSDNGGLSSSESSPTCNTPLAEGKGWMYEGGTRVPLIAKWPGVIKPGQTSSEVVSSVDYLPTILEAVGLVDKIPDEVEGRSILPVLRDGKASIDRDAVFWHYPHYGNQGGTPGASVRSGEYKLIQFFEDSRVELYNLVDDIEENHDLADKLPEVRDRLLKLLHDWQNKVEAKFPVPNPDWLPMGVSSSES
jgi:arylsulfatase A-like enzyme